MEALAQPAPRREGEIVRGEILLFDHFGNGITNITQNDLGAERPMAITLGNGETVRYCSHYAEMAATPEQIAAIWNSDGHLELALYGASLRQLRNLAAGEPVRVTLAKG